jgi:hypothetical protein
MLSRGRPLRIPAADEAAVQFTSIVPSPFTFISAFAFGSTLLEVSVITSSYRSNRADRRRRPIR